MVDLQELAGYGWLLIQGCLVTIQITVFGSALAFLLALIVGLAQSSSSHVVRAVATAYVEFFRGTSLFVQLFWVYFVFPFWGVSLPPLVTGIAVLGLNVSAYAAVVVRSALAAVAHDQTEACIALNFSKYQRLRYVLLPQAFVIMLPTLNNNVIELLKGTSVLSLITITELTFQAQLIRSSTGNTAVPFLIVIVLYFAISWTVTRLFRKLESKLHHPV